jgi:ADP-ribose pyrophosphatase YjhB (NUDIX family)
MNFVVASGPVIIENNKVLLTKHGDDNFWKFIGGKIESFDFEDPFNSLETACRREAKEEMGVELEIIRPLKSMMFQKPNDPDTQVILIHYLAKKISEIKPGADIKEYNWFDINNLPPDCAPNIKPVIDSIN